MSAIVKPFDMGDAGDDEAQRLRKEERERSRLIGEGTSAPMPPLMGLDEMLQQLVYISEGSRVALRGSPNTVLPFSEFRRHACASQTLQQKGRPLMTCDLWLQDEKRITVHTLTFHPGAPEFTIDPEGRTALNLWTPRRRQPVNGDKTPTVAPFLEHVAFLVPDAEERGRFLDWLAHIEQQPGVLPHTHYLMVTPQTGIGRNWLASLLARVWPGEVQLGFDLVGSLTSGFNGCLSCRTVVIVDELKSADSGYSAMQHAQQFKAMLTTEVRTINPKYGRVHHERNAVRFLMFSQHDDALPLEEYDRRVIVIENPTERKAPEYYSCLYPQLDDTSFIAAVAQWLAERDIRNFNPSQPAPMNPAKQRAIEAFRSDAEKALIALHKNSPRTVMTAGEITEYLDDQGLARPQGKAMSSAYKGAGIVPLRTMISIYGKQHRVVALRNADELNKLSAGDLTRYYLDERSANASSG